MFDEPKNPNQINPLNQPPVPPMPSSSVVPPLLPRQPQPQPPMPPTFQSTKEPEDIYGDVDRVTQKPLPPRQALPAFDAPASRPSVVPPAFPKPQTPKAFNWKKIFMIGGLVILGGGVLSAGAYYGYTVVAKNLSSKTVTNVNNGINNTNTNQPTTGNNVPVNVNAPAVSPNANANPVVNQAQVPEAQLDTDKDGLTDSEEKLYGTDPNKADTDNDGLTDRDEVKVFKTDPNNPDTDGDSFIDGKEVKSGYDPKGPGKLLKIQ